MHKMLIFNGRDFEGLCRAQEMLQCFRSILLNRRFHWDTKIMKTMSDRFLIAIALAFALLPSANAGFINGGFESPVAGAGTNTYPTSIPGWKTTDSSFEIWGSGFYGVPAYEGIQFAELNAFIAGTLYQDVTGVAAGSRVGFQFAHRGRAGVDTMNFLLTDLGLDGLLGGGDDTVLFTKNYSDGTSAWGFYDASAESAIYSLGNTVRFSYTAVDSVGGPSYGNFLDAADFGVGVGGVPADSVPDAASTLGLVSASILGLACLRRRFARATLISKTG